MPLLFLILLSLISPGNLFSFYYWKPFVLGILMFFPAFIVLALFNDAFMLSYGNWNIYFYFLYNDLLLYFLAAAASYFIIFGYPSRYSGPGKFIELFSFFAGFIMMVNLSEIIKYTNNMDFYTLFLLPLLRALLITAAAELISRAFLLYGYVKHLVVAAVLAAVFLIGIIPCLFKLNYSVFSFILLFLAFIPAGWIFLKQINKIKGALL